MSNPFGGKGSGSGSSPSQSTPTDLTPLAAGLESIAGGLTNIAGEQTTAAQPFLAGGTSQYQAGLTDTLTPSQQALSDFELGQANTRTASTFADLGLGGSTMATQDMNANDLANLALKSDISMQNERMGLAAAQLGDQFLGGGGTSLAQAGNQLTGAGTILGQQGATNQASKSALNSMLGSLAGVSSGNQSGGLTGNLGGLFSGSGPFSASSLGKAPSISPLGSLAGDLGSGVTADELSALIAAGGF